MKKTIKLNESELKHLVMETTKRYIREMAGGIEDFPAGLEGPNDEEGEYVDDYEKDLEAERMDDEMDDEILNREPDEREMNRHYNFNPDPVAAIEDEDDYQALEPVYDDEYSGLYESVKRAVRKTINSRLR